MIRVFRRVGRVSRHETRDERGEARGSGVAAPRARSTLGRALWPSCGEAARRAGPARLVGNSGAVCSVGAPARPVLTPQEPRTRAGRSRRRRSRVVVAAPSCCRLVARCWHGWGGRRFTPGFHVKSEPTPGAVRAGIINNNRAAGPRVRVPRLRGGRCALRGPPRTYT